MCEDERGATMVLAPGRGEGAAGGQRLGPSLSSRSDDFCRFEVNPHRSRDLCHNDHERYIVLGHRQVQQLHCACIVLFSCL